MTGEECVAILDKMAAHARSKAAAERMDDPEFGMWSARASGLEDASEHLERLMSGESLPLAEEIKE